MARTLLLDHIVHSDLKSTKAVFSDLRRFSEFHPLFIGIEETGNSTYIIKERMPFGGFPFKYKAVVIDNAEKNEVMYIAYPFFITLTITFAFSSDGPDTRIKESIHIKGPIIATDILRSLIGKMHPRVVADLNKKMLAENGKK
ncbi:MAG TPA: hypothetical protein VGC65_10205 [Bacteroidia bacterium]|jgi:hypothetical protein